MENLAVTTRDPRRLPDPAFWAGKQVYLTGHTGFKGAWLALWLRALGSRVTGYALAPPGPLNLFELAAVGRGMTHELGDIRIAETLAASLARAQPDIVLHLAAQSLVRKSYREPVATYATNVMGTVHLLEAVRQVDKVRAVVVVSSDKCYENREWLWGYREGDALGGHDPYSSSKGCTELVTHAMRRSFFHQPGVAAVGSARAGNVIGGGDWAEDRLLPDAMRAFAAHTPLVVRAPQAVRPWQHVFEPLRGYLLLAEALWRGDAHATSGWNFGPDDVDCRTVREVIDVVRGQWPGAEVVYAPPPGAPHEAHLLKLDCSKAHTLLTWRPRWDLPTAIARTVAWYRAHSAGADMREISLAELAAYADLST